MELPKRNPVRLKEYDYSQNGYYFITVCVKGKHEMLGKIVGGGVPDAPKFLLSQYGIITEKYLKNINIFFNNVAIDKYVIMPNHIHLILIVNNLEAGTSRTPSPTNAIVPSTISTFKRFVNRECGFSLFQRSYHDHIIRNQQEYQRIWQYIDQNPLKWQDDCYYTNSI